MLQYITYVTTATLKFKNMAVPSMTLKFTLDDAQRIVKASEALKKSVRCLQKSRADVEGSKSKESNDPPVPQRVVSTSDSESVASGTGEETTRSSSPRSLYALLVEAAEDCDDGLIRAFVHELKREEFNTQEMRTSLLIFLDSNKKPKTLSAFESLCSNGERTIESEKTDRLSLDHSGIVSLFRCFLSSICLCIKDNSRDVKRSAESDCSKPNKVRRESEQSSPSGSKKTMSPLIKGEGETQSIIPRNSPSFDTMLDQGVETRHLSESIKSEIVEIATFAADHLYANAKGKDEAAMVSYGDFEEWYKNGGFAVVPWLELLHLSNWNHIGHGTVSANNSPSNDDRKVEPDGGVVEMQVDETTSAVDPVAKKLRSSDTEPKTDITPNFFMVEEAPPPSKSLVTFDFTGATFQGDTMMGSGHSPFCINITEDNLVTLRTLVTRTGLSSRLPSELTKVLLAHSTKIDLNGKMVYVMDKDEFGTCIREIVPVDTARTFSLSEMESFSIYFTNFFACYENSHEGLGKSMIDVKEFAIGFSLLCKGNKSSKLVNGFELLDEHGRGFLTTIELTNYIRSYLAMLVGVSLLSEHAEKHEALAEQRKKEILEAVVNGAKWTINHFLNEHDFHGEDKDEGKFPFEAFAQWYTNGGFNYAPWLELLDLKKFLSLLPDSPALVSSTQKEALPSAFRSGGRSLSPRRRKAPGGYLTASTSDVLFTFPLAKERSLVVLREDATYVRSVVEKLGLLSMSPDDVWNGLYSRIKQCPPLPPQPWSRTRHHKPGKGKSIDVDQQMFVRCMEELMSSKSRKHSPTAARETLQNFFQSFDLHQIDRVALNQLMGGLSLLCGGKKSTKLAFSFGLFDSRKGSKTSVKHPSLDVDDLYIFLRSFLIVMFSCCRQSLDLSADSVSRYIADTSHMVADDVMRFQWHTRSKDRVDFDEFGEWYNEGGFETAPWLELLDLNKWVLVDNLDALEHHRQLPPPNSNIMMKSRSLGGGDYCPSPPPEDSVDPSFFADDDHAIMPMDSMDDMDLILMQQPSHDKENDGFILGKDVVPFSLTPSPRDGRGGSSSNALKFHLVSSEPCGGYMVSVSQKRVRHLRHVLVESGLFSIDAEVACQKILGNASKDCLMTKDDFDSAMRDIIGRGKSGMSVETQRNLSDLLEFIFSAFDREKTGRISAIEIACGFTVLCNGKKSDKLEYAFEMLDVKRQGRLVRRDVSRYLRSFLTVLMCVTTSSLLHCSPSEDTLLFMNGKACETNVAAMIRAADAGSSWAAVQAFKGCYAGRAELDHLNFDDFADWYTTKGYSCIPWLELLDLRKWVITE